jgi:hypothetical protein
MDKRSGRDTSISLGIDPVFTTATEGIDFLLPSSPLTLTAGTTLGYFRIPIFDDSLFEGDETVQFQLYNPENATIGINDTYTLTILDDEVAHAFCGQYTIGLLERSGDTVSTSIVNNGTGPIYITGINITWSNNQNLNRIRLDGEDLWLGLVRPFPGIEWTQHDLQRRVDGSSSKLLQFRFSNSSNPDVTNVTVTLDVPCPPLTGP